MTMSSKAWFKSAAPRLIRKFRPDPAVAAGDGAQTNRSIEVWTTTCIVTNFGMKRSRSHLNTSTDTKEGGGARNCSVLINPANPDLSGPHKFPYFPQGGPEPKQQPTKDAHHIMGYVTQWGGMEVGGGMMFAAAVVDGLVHQLGGVRLRAECKLKGLTSGGGEACPVGSAVVTSPGGPELQAEYDCIVHTVPPFFAHHSGSSGGDDDDVVELLRSCYRSSFDMAFDNTHSSNNRRVAVPLLGAGCRGFPLDVALRVAAEESVRWMESCTSSTLDTAATIMTEDGKDERDEVIAFGLLEEDVAANLVSAIEESCTSKQ